MFNKVFLTLIDMELTCHRLDENKQNKKLFSKTIDYPQK